jgi:hypothetical protein
VDERGGWVTLSLSVGATRGDKEYARERGNATDWNETDTEREGWGGGLEKAGSIGTFHFSGHISALVFMFGSHEQKH